MFSWKEVRSLEIIVTPLAGITLFIDFSFLSTLQTAILFRQVYHFNRFDSMDIIFFLALTISLTFIELMVIKINMI